MGKKGRIDHLLVTPKLLEYIRDASLIFTIDIEKAERGPGFFRANPNLINHPNYKVLIDNVIRFTIIDSLKDKTSHLYHQIITNFIDKLTVQEEIVSLEIIKAKHNWKVNDRIQELEDTLINITQNEVSNNTLLTMDLNTELDNLQEYTLSEMRTHTILFQTTLNKQKHDIKKYLLNKLEELNEQIHGSRKH